MKYWFLIFLSLSFFTINIVPETSYAKTGDVKKTSAKKSTKKKSSVKKSKKSKKSAKKSRRRNIATAPAYAPRYAEFLVDGETGRILHQENANETRYPASLTKMMTIYLTFEQLKAGHLRLNQDLRVSAYAASMPKTNLSLSPGDDITVKEALLGLIIHSANDAAVVLGENISGNEDNFAKLMTQRARQLGMNGTTFKNACGLHDPGQVTTAKDMALLAIALKKHYPEYYSMFARTDFDFHGRTYESHNRVTRSYSGAEGLKTGYVRASGFNLVTSATRYDGNLVGVVLGGRSGASRDERMKALLDAGFEKLAENKKKGNRGSVAGRTSNEGSMDFAGLEPAAGNAEPAAVEEVKDVKPAAKKSIHAPKKEEPAKVAAIEDTKIETKHFANEFVPAPKTKPRKVASLR